MSNTIYVQKLDECDPKPICPNCGSPASYYYFTGITNILCLDTENCGKKVTVDTKNFIDISYRGEGIGSTISNLHPFSFNMDGVICESMEGFIRSLVEKNHSVQKEICKLSGVNAYKLKFALRDWRDSGLVYWQGKEYARESDEYNQLITEAFDSLFHCSGLFSKILISTRGKFLTHSIGCYYKSESLLTATEYISQLYRLRDN